MLSTLDSEDTQFSGMKQNNGAKHGGKAVPQLEFIWRHFFFFFNVQPSLINQWSACDLRRCYCNCLKVQTAVVFPYQTEGST